MSDITSNKLYISKLKENIMWVKKSKNRHSQDSKIPPLTLLIKPIKFKPLRQNQTPFRPHFTNGNSTRLTHFYIDSNVSQHFLRQQQHHACSHHFPSLSNPLCPPPPPLRQVVPCSGTSSGTRTAAPSSPPNHGDRLRRPWSCKVPPLPQLQHWRLFTHFNQRLRLFNY